MIRILEQPNIEAWWEKFCSNYHLTSTGSQTNSWDHRNRLTTVYASSSPSTFYLYDHTTARVAKGSGTATTTYTSKYYELISATSTKYIWAGDTLLATIEGNGTATSTYYSHPDHLGSTNAVTNSSGTLTQTLDYYPYGSKRINSGTDTSNREFIGQMFDESSNLSYLNARYYSGDRGQFLSEDPTFLAVGGPDLADKMGLPPSSEQHNRNEGALRALLSDPQLANSYSYGRNNPITNKDPNGNCDLPCLVAAILAGVFLDVNTAHAPAPGEELSPSYAATGINISGLAIPSGAAKNAAKSLVTAGDTISGLKVTIHAAEGFAERNIRPEQVGIAIKNGIKYLDTKTGNLLHVVGERAKGGYTIVTDRAQKTLVSVEDFIRDLAPKKFPDRFKRLDKRQ